MEDIGDCIKEGTKVVKECRYDVNVEKSTDTVEEFIASVKRTGKIVNVDGLTCYGKQLPTTTSLEVDKVGSLGKVFFREDLKWKNVKYLQVILLYDLRQA
jgi:hypothetical protein